MRGSLPALILLVLVPTVAAVMAPFAVPGESYRRGVVIGGVADSDRDPVCDATACHATTSSCVRYTLDVEKGVFPGPMVAVFLDVYRDATDTLVGRAYARTGSPVSVEARAAEGEALGAHSARVWTQMGGIAVYQLTRATDC